MEITVNGTAVPSDFVRDASASYEASGGVSGSFDLDSSVTIAPGDTITISYGPKTVASAFVSRITRTSSSVSGSFISSSTWTSLIYRPPDHDENGYEIIDRAIIDAIIRDYESQA